MLDYRDMSLAELFSTVPRGAGADPRGYYELGYRFCEGSGVPKDLERGFKYYEQSADGGHIPAKVTLAGFYIEGETVPRDLKKAWALLAEAQAHGSQEARGLLEKMQAAGKGLVSQHQFSENVSNTDPAWA